VTARLARYWRGAGPSEYLFNRLSAKTCVEFSSGSTAERVGGPERAFSRLMSASEFMGGIRGCDQIHKSARCLLVTRLAIPEHLFVEIRVFPSQTFSIINRQISL